MRTRRMHRRRRRGFTLMEVLLVLAIIVILGSMVGIFIAQMQAGAYEDLAKTQMGLFETQLKAYQLHVGTLPNSNQGLAALMQAPSDLPNPDRWRGPYSEKQIPPDPWGNQYQYEMISPVQYRMWSVGADGIDGTDDDVTVTNVPMQQ